MATNQIMFGGNILPCTVERFPDIHKAQRKFRQYNIPGRNGDIFFQSDAWENVIQSYQIYAGDGTYGSQAPWTELARCLYLDGYQELRDTYDPTHFRKAVFNGPIDVENSWNTHGRATIEFNCRPERYLVDGNNPISYVGAGLLDVRTVTYSGLSSDVQAVIDSNGLIDDTYFVFDFPALQDLSEDIFHIKNAPRAVVAYAALCVPTGTEATASSAALVKMNKGAATYGPEFSRRDYADFTGTSVILPKTLTNGQTPVFYFAFTVSPFFRLYESGKVITNNYMPSYPFIVLKRKSAFTGEIAACQIGSFSVWITDDPGNTYYFIDTENFSAAKSSTLDGARELANNVRIDSGIKLEKGENNVFTSEYFDMTLTPNWWEL